MNIDKVNLSAVKIIMSESKVTVTAATIIAIFNTASVTFHNEFFNWAFSNERDDNYPIAVSESNKRDNAFLYKEWLLEQWTKDFNIVPEEFRKLQSYLSELLDSQESDDE